MRNFFESIITGIGQSIGTKLGQIIWTLIIAAIIFIIGTYL